MSQNRPRSLTELFLAFSRLALQGFGGDLGIDQFHLHDGIPERKPSPIGKLLGLLDLLPAQSSAADQGLSDRRTDLLLVLIVHTTQTLVVVTLPLGIDQAQHRLGKIVEQFLGLELVGPRGVLAYEAVELLVERANLLGIVLERHQT